MIQETLALYFISLCLIIGTIFSFVAAIGLLKLNNAMSRLHAPTKAGTVGIGAFLLASAVNSYVYADGSLSELLILGFLFVTAPISANFISKVNMHSQACTLPPPPPRDDTWSTFNVSAADLDIEETGS